jgi:peroxiredoxin
MKKILALLALTLLLLPVFAEKMPDFRLPNMAHEDVSLASLLGKGPVIIDFWADYCKPCKEAMPALNTLVEKYEDLTVVMISIDAPKAQARAKSYLRSKNFKFINLFDPDKTLAKKLNVVNPPHSFILNREGEIVYTHVGFEAGTEKVYERHVRNLLGLKDEAEDNKQHGDTDEHCGSCTGEHHKD